MFKRKLIPSLLILATLMVFVSADFEDLFTNIYSISTMPNESSDKYRQSSLQGGAYLYIKGSGFSTRSASSNVVRFDDEVTCPVIEFLTTSTQVVCQIPAWPEIKSVQVKVYVDDQRVATCKSCYLYYGYYTTPLLAFMIPNAAAPGDEIFYAGAERVTDTSDVDYVKIGNDRCDPSEQNEFEAITFGSSDLDQAPCNVPNLEAGRYPVSQRNLKNTGFAKKLNTVPTYRFNNEDPYDFLIVPKIESISNNAGSSEGQIITITGAGFSTSGDNVVNLADTECKILSESSTEITCELPARSASISTQGYHAGLHLELYNSTGIDAIKAGTAGTPGITGSRLTAEIPVNNDAYEAYGSKLSGYFKPPVSGSYKFVVSADDKAQLYLSQTHLDRTNLQKIVDITSATPYRFFMPKLSFTQYSDPISLTAGNLYYFELYHYESGGSDFATVGVIVPNTPNTVNNVPEIQSIKIDCPTDYEILQFKVAGVSGGKWKINFDFLSEDGKSIDRSTQTDGINYNANAGDVSNQIKWSTGFQNTATRKMLKSDGTETTVVAEAETFIYDVTFLNIRNNGKLPTIEATELTGPSVGYYVEQTQKPSDPVRGTFSTERNGVTAKFNYNAAGWELEQALRNLGFKDWVKAVQYDIVDYGAEWRIQYTGEGAGPVEKLSFVPAFTGCKSTASVQVTTLQAASNDLFYQVIPAEFLFTADATPQITIKSNGILGNCPNFNCAYEIQTTGIPEVSSSSYTSTTLSLQITGVTSGVYDQDDLRVFLGNTECQVTSFNGAASPATLQASCPTPEAGEFYPKVHFDGLGYAKIASGVSKIVINPVVSSVSPTEVNPNGGTILTVTGSGFPADLATAQERGFDVKIGSSACVLSSVTPTGFVCVNDAVSSGAALTVTLNGKSGSSSALTILAIVPTISTVTPTTVNSVLQSDITITGSNFDADKSTINVYLKNSTSTKARECLVYDANANQIKCKLLGASKGSYTLYVQTSKGYSDSKPFEVKSVVTSVSPSSGSAAGGTVLTIQGGTFSDITTQTLVFVGDQNIHCDVISSAPTEVTCKTRAKDKSYTNGSPQEVVVATRIQDETTCQNGGNTCSFTYSDSLTPLVTALDKNTLIPGDTLQITGSGFESNPSGTPPVVTIDGKDCSVTSSSDTEITVTVPTDAIPNIAGSLVVDVAGKGYASFTSANSTVQVTPSITSLSPTTGSTAGTLVTVTGAGFGEGVSVEIGGTACEVRSVTATQILCKATSTGAVSLSYGDFKGITCSACSSLTTSPSQTPTVSAITPLSPSSPSFTLTITGTLLTLNTPVIRLISQKDKTVSFTGTVGTNTATQITVSFSNVAAGTYSVEIALGSSLASTTSSVTVPLSASVSASVVSSIAGGATLTISGSGFFDNSLKEKNKVTVCGLPCEVTQSTGSSIQCVAPTFVNSQVKTTYPDIVQPDYIDGTFWSDSGLEANVTDLAFSTNYVSTLTDCQIGLDVGASLVAELSEIRFFPNPSITASTLSGTVIEGSNNNSTFTTIATIDANAYDGWNTIQPATTSRYRYLRFRGATSTAKCALSELQFYGYVLSDNTATNLDAITCQASVTVNDKTQAISTTAVNYKSSKTPVLTSIEPTMGTTAGNTLLTLTGTGFITDSSKVKVYIDDVECAVQSATSTVIKCLTGAAPDISIRRSSLESELKIQFQDQGYVVTNDIKYFYVDRWSSINTWGGISLPVEGDSISIPSGQTVLLDISPPKLDTIIIQGALIFEDKDLDLHCNFIIVRNGRLQIGTWEKPMTSKISITLYGTKESPQLPIYGNKVIAMMEGIIDIHGKQRSYTWTVLDSTAAAGDTSIIVRGAVDWVAGEQIVIASTDHDHYQSENRIITSVSTSGSLTTLNFAEPLKFEHYADVQTVDGIQYDMRAEVGLLTRNIKIQGDSQSQDLKYGAHIMIHSKTGDDSSVGRISYTEVTQAGQAYNLGRYPIHFHLIGNVRQSYVIGNAIHHTYNRAVTIHGVHFLKVQKNVAHWCMGHTIFIEDGIETHNVIEDNLVINTIASTALLNTDQTPASFWITNPNNIWRRNHAAGSDRYGFWFDLREHPEGPSATTSICPIGERLGEFTDNLAHSSGRYGLRIFHELIPRTYPCSSWEDFVANPPIPAAFTNFEGWKNRRSTVIGEKMGALTFKNIKASNDHRCGIELSDGNYSPEFTLTIENAWIAGYTPENSGNKQLFSEKEVRGIITPKADFLLVKNVQFSNFDLPGMVAIETCSHCEVPASSDSGARTTFFQGLKFNNVDQRVRFNVPYKEILIDNDGTLTDNNGKKGVVTYFYDHLDVPGCTKDLAVYDGLVCDETVTIRRIEFFGLEPFGSFELMDIVIERKEDNPNGVLGYIPYRKRTNKSWATPFVMGYSYLLHWFSRADFNNLEIAPSQVIRTSDPATTLIWNHTEYRETYDVTIKSSPTENRTNQTTLWTRTTASARKSGDWYHDVDNSLFYMTISGNAKYDLKVDSIKCRLNCPTPVTQVPKDGIIRLWSNATQWPNQVVPKDGDDVVIPADWTLKLDENTAKLGTLNVNGDFYFDETKDDLVLTAERIWVQGQMFIGNSSEERYPKNAKVLLTGIRKSKTLILGGVQDVSNKVLAVTGNVTMYGQEVQTIFTRLLAPAEPGATTITVASDIDWKVGDDIVLAPSQRNDSEFESFTITDINSGVITLDKALTWYHYGAATITKDTGIGDLDMRTEVGLLTRNVKVVGSDEDLWGGRIYVGEIYDKNFDYYYRGRVDLDSIEMKNLGQKDNVLAGLTFDQTINPTNDPSTVRRSVSRDSAAYELRIIGSNDVTVEECLFYKAYKYQIIFEKTNTNVKFNKNLVIGNYDRGYEADAGDNAKDLISMLYAYGAKLINSEITNNIFAGCNQNCIILDAADCDNETPETYTFRNNVVHSGETGWLFTAPNIGGCTGVSYFTGYKLDLGLVHFWETKNLKATNIIMSDSRMGFSLNTGGYLDPVTISLTNSYVAGLSLVSEPGAYFNKTECSNNTGVVLSVSVTEPKLLPPIPSQLPWYKVKADHVFSSVFTVTDVTFENYKNGLVDGCEGNRMFATNPHASDASSATMVSGITKVNVGDTNRFFFEENDDSWIGIGECGGWPCTGIQNVIIKDLDGSVTGGIKSILAVNPGVYDSETCTISRAENAYICADEGWGLLTFDSLDVDARTRVISPVTVSDTSSFKNDLNSYRDHHCDGFYRDLKRYSRFHSVVESGKDYQVKFTGTNPDGIRWQLQGAIPSQSVTAQYSYATPQSVRVTKANGDIIAPLVMTAGKEKYIESNDPCGTNLYNIDNRHITIKLTGDEDCVLSVKLVNSIRASIRYDISITEFYSQSGPSDFIDMVAAVLKINPASIRIVDIRSGSTIFNFFIDSSYQGNTTEDTIAAKKELNELVGKLNRAIKSGDLKVAGANVLDYSFAVDLTDDTTDASEKDDDKTSVWVIIGPILGAIILIVTSYILYVRYIKKRRVLPSQYTGLKKAQPDASFNGLQTASPILYHSKNDLMMSPDSHEISPEKKSLDFLRPGSAAESALRSHFAPNSPSKEFLVANEEPHKSPASMRGDDLQTEPIQISPTLKHIPKGNLDENA